MNFKKSLAFIIFSLTLLIYPYGLTDDYAVVRSMIRSGDCYTAGEYIGSTGDVSRATENYFSFLQRLYAEKIDLKDLICVAERGVSFCVRKGRTAPSPTTSYTLLLRGASLCNTICRYEWEYFLNRHSSFNVESAEKTLKLADRLTELIQ